MTASSVDDRSSLIDIGARFDYAARVNDTVALRRCALYRRAFRERRSPTQPTCSDSAPLRNG